eukprot:7209720-Prymnesium_polylepis.1
MTPLGIEVARSSPGRSEPICACESLAAVCVEFVLEVSAEQQSVLVASVEQFADDGAQPQLLEEYSLRVVSGAMPLQMKDCSMRPVVASSPGAIV